MNFFEHQEHARRTTRRLLVLFLLAVLVLIAITDLFASAVLVVGSDAYTTLVDVPNSTHVFISLAVLCIIILASLYRVLSLSNGGRQVAEEMGARLVLPATTDRNERRLINVVEEMAIASGFPVPQVYILETHAMNAFAAGHTPHDAIVAVTKGTLESLNREELQGVIAHEFSHILNGDMRLNLRLIGVLFGILFIGLIGQKIIRIASRSRDGLQFVLVGAGLMVIGYGGLFFGNWIKATISRQREYLADASAVQFTRSPFGISDALKKIGGSVSGTHLHQNQAEEYSHLYFQEGVEAPFFGLFNTHPPIADRIRRLDPGWDGRFIEPKVKPQTVTQRKDKTVEQRAAGMATAAAVMEAIMTIGMPTANHVNYARQLIKEMPAPLLEATREPLDAYALVLGLMMQPEMLRSITWQDRVLKDVDRPIRQALRKILVHLMSLDIKYRLPLIELAILPLKSLSEPQKALFNEQLLAIIHDDGSVEVWEWALHYWIGSLSLNKPIAPKPIYDDFNQLKKETSALLSAVFHASHQDQRGDKHAFEEAQRLLGVELSVMQEEELNSDLLIHAVAQLRNLKPLVKPKFLQALCQVAQHDGLVEAKEIEMIRTISEGIGCPMPPVLDMG